MVDKIIISFKMMELWDGAKKYDDNNMPNFTNVRTTIFHVFIYYKFFLPYCVLNMTKNI